MAVAWNKNVILKKFSSSAREWLCYVNPNCLRKCSEWKTYFFLKPWTLKWNRYVKVYSIVYSAQLLICFVAYIFQFPFPLWVGLGRNPVFQDCLVSDEISSKWHFRFSVWPHSKTLSLSTTCSRIMCQWNVKWYYSSGENVSIKTFV